MPPKSLLSYLLSVSLSWIKYIYCININQGSTCYILKTLWWPLNWVTCGLRIWARGGKEDATDIHSFLEPSLQEISHLTHWHSLAAAQHTKNTHGSLQDVTLGSPAPPPPAQPPSTLSVRESRYGCGRLTDITQSPPRRPAAWGWR